MMRQQGAMGMRRRWVTLMVRFAGMLAMAVLFLPWPGMATTGDAAESKNVRVGQEISIQDLIFEAVRNNPAIEAARQRIRAAEESYRIDTGYPDPQVMVTYYPAPIETRLGPQDWNATLSQAIPYPGKLGKAGEVAASKAELAVFALDKVTRDVTEAVKESFQELVYIQEARAIVDHQVELFDNLINTAESAYAQDRVALVTVINAHSHMDALQKDLFLLDSMAQTETAMLNSLLGRDMDADFNRLEAPLLEPSGMSLENLYRLSETNQEDIQMANTRIHQSEAELSLARYQNLPEVKVGLFYAAIGSPDVAMRPSDEGRDAFGVQFGVSLPIWGKKNSGRIDKARAEMAAAASDKSSRINDIRARVRSLYFRLEQSRGIIALYEDKLLPQARTAVDASDSWFLEKQPNFSEFVEAQSMWYQFQLALARTRADYGKDLARLERLIDDRNQGSEVRSQRSEVGGQKSEDNGQ